MAEENSETVRRNKLGLHQLNLIKQKIDSNQLISSPLASSAIVHKINADTGTTGNFIAVSDLTVLLDIKPTLHGITVELPNGEKIVSTHTATLNMPTIPLAARSAHIFPALTGSLLSIGLLTDAGLTATYTADKLVVTDPTGTVVLTGTRSARTKLWMIDLNNPCVTTHTCASLIRHENDSQLVKF